MAQRFQNPFPQFLTDAPALREGSRLFFYQTGTSTKLNTYPTSDLSGAANANPITLNASGYSPVHIFLQNREYKVVLAGPDSAGTDDPPSNIIWTADPVKGSDYSILPKWSVGSGNPNGVVAGTAGSSGVMPDKYWDYTNNIEYTCTSTGTALTAVWTALNSASTVAVPMPQGRLTLTSATPVLASDVVAGTAVYYTPYRGNLVPIYNGASFTATEFTEMTLTLASQHALNTLYDIFVFSNSSVLTLVTGPAWSVSTAGSGARGTGAGTTELSRVKGFHTNAVQITGRNGSTTYTIGANLATFLGTMLIDGTAGQCTCHVAWGQSRRWSLWNAFNRVPIIVKAGDSTASWAYASATLRASNNAAANGLSIVTGLPEEAIELDFKQKWGVSGSAGSGGRVGIGVNSTTAASGFAPAHATTAASGGINVSLGWVQHAQHIMVPTIGRQDITALEAQPSATSGDFYGSETNMLLRARLMG